MHNTITAAPHIEGQTVSDYMNMRNRRRGSSMMQTSNKKRGGRIIEQNAYKPVMIDSVNDRDHNTIDIPDTQKRYGTAGDPSC